MPMRASSGYIAISHQWFRGNKDPSKAHPAGTEHEKYRALKNHFSKEGFSGKYFWMDYLSIPQSTDEKAKQNQGKKKYCSTTSTRLIAFIECKFSYISLDHIHQFQS